MDVLSWASGVDNRAATRAQSTSQMAGWELCFAAG
jgi:hypothetical protein